MTLVAKQFHWRRTRRQVRLAIARSLRYPYFEVREPLT